MQRVLTIVVPILIAFAIIGFFVFGLMQRPDISEDTQANTPIVLDTNSPADADGVEQPGEATELSSTELNTITTTVSSAEPLTTTQMSTITATVSVPIQIVEKPIRYEYEIVNTFPHDPKAFLQGLVWEDGIWYEGTGLYGESTLRRVDAATGEVLQKVDLDASLFGEGITIFDGKIYQLTWKAQRGFIYDKESFELIEEFTYPTEGWGITHDGEQLIMSDGTPTIYFWDPATLEATRTITVTDNGRPVRNLNELEYINGLIYANVWQTPRIVIINPESGEVEGEIILERDELLTPDDFNLPVDVLNGIAYDADGERLFVTGKLWPKIFEIKLVSPFPSSN